VAAVARRLPSEQVGIAVEAGCLGEEAADVIASAISQEQRGSVLDDGEMAPVTRDQQIRRRGKRRRNSSDRERSDPEEPDASVPQTQPDESGHH
jgi:hypothetical protein